MDRVLIVYYTGTGSTELIANEVKNNLANRGVFVEMHRLTECTKEEITLKASSGHQLILIYAVHAFNAPDIVYKWLRTLDDQSVADGENKKAMIISVSGGGDMITNTACRLPAKRLLTKKGYRVVTEAMAAMPNNWMSPTPMPVSKALIAIMPRKVNEWLDAFQQNQTYPVLSTKLIDRVMTKLGRFEAYGAVQFGKNIKVSDACNGCGWCEKHCPSGNIKLSLKDGASFPKPVFDKVCDFCLGCVYGCPQKALAPGKLKFAVIPTGYPLDEYKQPLEEALDDSALAAILESGSWKGVRRYLGI